MNSSTSVLAALPPRHFPRLDGLRGIAILAVMLTHFTPRIPGATGLVLTVQRTARLGWLGVDLFFVLSGFLITGILLDARDDAGRWRTFFVRRALRIFPLYWGVLAALALLFVVRPEGGVPGWAWLAWLVPYLGNYPKDLHLAALPDATRHFWSLGVEEQFYLLWPPVVWALTPRGLLRWSAVLVAAAVASRAWLLHAVGGLAPYHFLPARMDALVLGGVVALALRTPAWWARARQVAPWAGGAALTALAVLVAARGRDIWAGIDQDPAMQLIGYTLAAGVAAAAVVWAVAAPAGAGRWLDRGPLPWTGRYAYGLYVYHGVVWMLVLPVFARRGWLGPDPTVHPTQATLWWWAVGGGLSVALALPSYHLFEAPILRLKDRWAPAHGRRDVRALQPAAPAPDSVPEAA